MLGKLVANLGIELFRLDIDSHLLRHALLVGSEEIELFLVDIIDALEALTLANRPGERSHVDMKFLLQFVEQVEGIATLAVHLVDKDNDGSIPHTADFHQFARLCLHTFGRIHHNDRGIDSRKRSIGIFGKVLVAWRIEDVDLIGLVLLGFGTLGTIVELHHRRGDRDTTLLLNVHPVGGGALAYFVALHRTGYLNLSTKEEEFLGQGSLTRIRVADDGKGASAFYFVHACAALMRLIHFSSESSQ